MSNNALMFRAAPLAPALLAPIGAQAQGVINGATNGKAQRSTPMGAPASLDREGAAMSHCVDSEGAGRRPITPSWRQENRRRFAPWKAVGGRHAG